MAERTPPAPPASPNLERPPSGLPGHGREVWRPELTAQAFPFHVVFESLRDRDKRSHLVKEHFHGHYEFLCIEAGAYRGRLDGVTVEVPPGGVLMVGPGRWHSDLCGGPIRFRAVTLRLLPGPSPQLSADLLATGAPPVAQIAPAAGAGFHDLLGRMREAGRRSDPYAVFALDALATEFVCLFLAHLPVEVISPLVVDKANQRRFWGELEAFFDLHLLAPLTLEEIARGLGIGARTLTARCQHLYGESPVRLFAKRRLEKAREMIVQTSIPIKAVSEHFGFENQYHFSKVYKRVHGVPPARHRVAAQ